MKKIVLALFTMLFLSTSIFAQSDLQVLAVVKYNKNEFITVKQLKKRVGAIEKQLDRKLTVDEKKEVLDSFIDEKLIVQAAQKEGLSITDSQLNQTFEASISQLFGMPITESQFDDIIKSGFNMSVEEFFEQNYGLSKKEYKEKIRTQMIINQYVIYKSQSELQKISPTDKDIRMFYEANKSNLVWKDSAKIFVVAVPNGDDKNAAKVKANELRNKYADKKVTSEQLKVQSQKEGAGFVVGENIVEKSQQGMSIMGLSMDKLIALLSQDEGFVSDVMESDEGYSFISILKKYDAKMLGLSDIVRPETTVTVYEYLRMLLSQQLQGQFLQQKVIEISESLHVPANVEMKKTGAELDKLLEMGD